MPTQSEHKQKSDHNEKFYNEVNNNFTDYMDWKIISIFYSAVHLVDMYAAKSFQKHLWNHRTRNDFVYKFLYLIRDEYDLLYQKSRIVRYDDCSDCSSFSDEFTNDILPAFNKIKRHITNIS